ncbi:MAG: class I SAM-dependent methyltransferase, partial [Nocardioidaceae bacterium]
ERVRLRGTFDAAAARYERARPDYPTQLYDALVDLAGLRPGDRLLEVGPATGKATVPLASRGFQITGVELGIDLVARAAAQFADSESVAIVQDNFETWTPPAGVDFDLVYAATAWHWIDPTVRYRRAADALRPGGYLAVWSTGHVVPDGGDPFFHQIQDVYDEIGEGNPADWHFPRPGELAELSLERDSGGMFERVATRHFDWETGYDAEGYIELLDTFSGHLSMQAWQRSRLFGEIRRRLATRPDGLVRRHWGAVLEVARLRS